MGTSLSQTHDLAHDFCCQESSPSAENVTFRFVLMRAISNCCAMGFRREETRKSASFLWFVRALKLKTGPRPSFHPANKIKC
jgi:hypothetical protein